MTKTTSKPFTFGELEETALFITFPIDGDDSGHGGYRIGHPLFTKLRKTSVGKKDENALRVSDATLVKCYENQLVLRIT